MLLPSSLGNKNEKLSLKKKKKVIPYFAARVSEIQSLESISLRKHWPVAAAGFKNQIFLGNNVFIVTLLLCFSF